LAKKEYYCFLLFSKEMFMKEIKIQSVLCVGLLVMLVGCGTTTNDPTGTNIRTGLTTAEKDELKGQGHLFGEPIFTTNRKKADQEDYGIGVNSFLWRASLETLAFMPLLTVEPFGGVITTDWYTPPQTPTERLKVNVVITDRQLRADGIKVSVFHQINDPKQGWQEAPVAQTTIDEIEQTILTRARQLKIESKIQ
jgi:hypothetical protein